MIDIFLGNIPKRNNQDARRGRLAVFQGSCRKWPFNPLPTSEANHCAYSRARIPNSSSPLRHFLILLQPPWPPVPRNLRDHSASSHVSTEAEKPPAPRPSGVVTPDQYWAPSTTTEKNLKMLRDRGLLPDPQLFEFVATKHQDAPAPDTKQVGGRSGMGGA